MKRATISMVCCMVLWGVACNSDKTPSTSSTTSNTNARGALSDKVVSESAAESDSTITARAKLALLADSATSGFDAEVEAKDGVVTLTGKVDTADARSAFERVLKEVEGVKRLSNKLDVSADAKRRVAAVSDTAIEDAIEKAMDTEPVLRGLSLAAESKAGVVTLGGTVDTREALVKAAQAIRKVPGVRSVQSTQVIITSDAK